MEIDGGRRERGQAGARTGRLMGTENRAHGRLKQKYPYEVHHFAHTLMSVRTTHT